MRGVAVAGGRLLIDGLLYRYIAKFCGPQWRKFLSLNDLPVRLYTRSKIALSVTKMWLPVELGQSEVQTPPFSTLQIIEGDFVFFGNCLIVGAVALELRKANQKCVETRRG